MMRNYLLTRLINWLINHYNNLSFNLIKISSSFWIRRMSSIQLSSTNWSKERLYPWSYSTLLFNGQSFSKRMIDSPKSSSEPPSNYPSKFKTAQNYWTPMPTRSWGSIAASKRLMDTTRISTLSRNLHSWRCTARSPSILIRLCLRTTHRIIMRCIRRLWRKVINLNYFPTNK